MFWRCRKGYNPFVCTTITATHASCDTIGGACNTAQHHNRCLFPCLVLFTLMCKSGHIDTPNSNPPSRLPCSLYEQVQPHRALRNLAARNLPHAAAAPVVEKGSKCEEVWKSGGRVLGRCREGCGEGCGDVGKGVALGCVWYGWIMRGVWLA